MQHNIKLQLLIAILLLAASACKRNEQSQQVNKRSFQDDAVIVTSTKAQKGIFYRELFNNGMIKASQSATLSFKQQGDIKEVRIKNGQRVQAGDILVVLEDFNQQQALQKAKLALDRALYSLEDALIIAGQNNVDSALVPKDIMKSCLIKSGYLAAQTDLRTAERNLKETRLVAPVSGLIANCELKANNPTGHYKTACTILNDRMMDVEFNVLESEYALIQNGLPVHIIPYALKNDTFPGVISAINPMVSENGMVVVQASFDNSKGRLIDGMNTQVIIRMAMPDKLIVPKEAVVLRQERKVVFTLKNDTAYWNYVRIGEENSRFATIENGIKEGAEVIVSGHLNIAHLSKVKLAYQ